MEPNNKKEKFRKYRKIAFAYTMIFQMIFTVIGLAILGYFIGSKINPDTSLNLILTGVGVVLGFFASITQFVQFLKREELYERRHRD